MGKGPRLLAAGTRKFGHRASSLVDHKIPLLVCYLINYWIDMQNLSRLCSTCTAHAQVDRLPPSWRLPKAWHLVPGLQAN